MTYKTLIALPFLAISLPAMAQDAGIDTNEDGNYSYPELVVAYPEMTEDSFMVLDVNSDGLLDADEIVAATEAGMLPATDS